MISNRVDVDAFIAEQGWPVKRAGSERITTCPFCDKAEHLYVNGENGLWKCHRCGESGNLYQLHQRLGLTNKYQRGSSPDGLRIQAVGDALGAQKKRIPMAKVEALHQALLRDRKALDYCTVARRWLLDAIKRMKLGLRVDGRGKWIAYPWLRRGECLGIKYRILPAFQNNYPQRFDREPGCESILYNADALDRFEEVILASGESDLMTFLTVGFENVVATTIGEGGLPPSAVDALATKKTVTVCYDSDEAGHKGAGGVAKRLGYDKVRVVRLPEGVRDVGALGAGGGTREDLEALLKTAAPVDVPTVLSVSQALDRLEMERAAGQWDETATTPWPLVNHRIGAWHGGNLIVLGAPQGTGKTTFALVLAMRRPRRAPVVIRA